MGGFDMNKSIILVFFVVLIMLIAGCENIDVSKLSDEDLERISEKAVVCNNPYMRIGTECCLDRNGNSICDRDEAKETQLSETEVVEAYLKNLAVHNIDEKIASTKDSLKYVTGYAEDYYNEELRNLKEQKRMFNEFYNTFYEKCIEIDTNEKCTKAQQSFLDNLNLVKKTDVNVITIELKEDGKSLHTEREEIYPNNKQTIIRDYLIRKEGKLWKIYDWIDEEGNKWSDISINEIKLQNDKNLKSLKETYDWGLNTIQETIVNKTKVEVKKDKCSYIDTLTGLTTTELEAEYQLCYQGKYYDYARTINNQDICEEIVKAWYYSPCIAYVASSKRDISLCENIRHYEWEAKLYYENLNTKDTCYHSFVYYSYADLSEIEVEGFCNKISNEQLKTQCLRIKGAGSNEEYTIESEEEGLYNNEYNTCAKELLTKECKKYNLIYTDYSDFAGFITCTDDGAYVLDDMSDKSKYLQVYAPLRTLQIMCGTYQNATEPKEKCKEKLFGELCSDVGLTYTDYSSFAGFITCSDDGFYILGEMSDNSKYKQVYISNNAVDERCS